MMQTIPLDDLPQVAPGAQCTFVCMDRDDDQTAFGPVSSPAMDTMGGWFQYVDQDDLDQRLEEITDNNDFADEEMLVLVIVLTEPLAGGQQVLRPRIYLTPFNLRDADAEDEEEEGDESGEYEDGEGEEEEEESSDAEGRDEGDSHSQPRGGIGWLDQ